MPDLDAARKPPKRFWLFAPYAAALIALALWSTAWLFIQARVASRLDAVSAQARAQGFTLDWQGRHIGGYPFRITVTLDQPRVGEPSGWGVSAPTAEAVANAYDLNHWVIAAPDGLTLTRPGAGAVAITGRALRASWVGEGEAAPRVVLEGLGLAFTPASGAKPFALARAGRAAVYTRAQPGDRIEARLMLYDTWAAPGSRLDQMVGQRPIALVWQGMINTASAFHGRDAPAAARAWSAAGGAVTTELGGLAAGPLAIGVRTSRLTAGPDGRLDGTASLEVRGGGRASGALGAPGGTNAKTRADLTFQDGFSRLGPLRLGAAPKLF